MKRRRIIAALVVVAAVVVLFGGGACCLVRPHRCVTTPDDELAVEKPEPFPPDGSGYDVYVYRGPRGGPDVILLHELPGLTPATVRLAKTLVDAGYTVHVPLIFGAYGHATLLQALTKCRGDFNCLEDGDGHFSTWLAALIADRISKQHGPAPGVAVIGMCMTGSAALAAAAVPGVKAVVISQPALPLPLTRWHRGKIGISKKRADVIRKAHVPMLALRFSKDCLASEERFVSLRREFDAAQLQFEIIDSGTGNPDGLCKDAHAVLTGELIPPTPGKPVHATWKALQRVIGFLDVHLGGPNATFDAR